MVLLSAYIVGDANQQTYYYWSSYDSFCPAGMLPPGFKQVTSITIPIAITAQPKNFGFAIYNGYDQTTTLEVTSSGVFRDLGSIPFSLDTATYPAITTLIPSDFTSYALGSSVKLENGNEVSIDWIETFPCENKYDAIAIGVTYKNSSGTAVYLPKTLHVNVIDLDSPSDTPVRFELYYYLYPDPVLDGGIPPGMTIKQVYLSFCNANSMQYKYLTLTQFTDKFYIVVSSKEWNTAIPIAIYEINNNIPRFAPEVHIPEYYLSFEGLSQRLPEDLVQRLEKLLP